MQLEATRQANELVGLFMALKPLKVSVNCFRTSALASSASSTAAAAFSSEIGIHLSPPWCRMRFGSRNRRTTGTPWYRPRDCGTAFSRLQGWTRLSSAKPPNVWTSADGLRLGAGFLGHLRPDSTFRPKASPKISNCIATVTTEAFARQASHNPSLGLAFLVSGSISQPTAKGQNSGALPDNLELF